MKLREEPLKNDRRNKKQSSRSNKYNTNKGASTWLSKNKYAMRYNSLRFRKKLTLNKKSKCFQQNNNHKK